MTYRLSVRQAAQCSVAITMAMAYELIVAYGSGSCLAYLSECLMPPEEPKGGGKRKGQMVVNMKKDFFGSAAFQGMLGDGAP